MQEEIYISIAKKLNGEASEAELQQIKDWLAEDPGNTALYKDLEQAWLQSDEIFGDGPTFNTTKAWDNISAHMQPAVANKPKRIALPAWARYAAAAAVLVLGIFVWRQYDAPLVTVVAKNGNTEVVLPDNSHIMLKKGSTLKYPEEFDGAERNVALEGEAFFDVARNEQQPFVISAQSAEVTVLGTSFNVKCTDDMASVVVKTGKVQMKSVKTSQSIVLVPGKKGLLKDGLLSEKNVSADNYLYWETGVMSFANVAFADVVNEMSEITETSIVFDSNYPAAAKMQLVNISFRNQAPEDMVAELCLITQSNQQKQGEKIIISK